MCDLSQRECDYYLHIGLRQMIMCLIVVGASQ